MAFSGPATRRTPLRGRLLGVAAAGVLTTVVLTGCGADDDPAAEPAGAASTPADGDADAPRLVQGGEPGEAAEEVPEDTTAPANEWTDDDERFYQQMIPHHAQALEMTDLAADRASDRRVRLLAERIAGAQGPEITMMAAWLDQRDLDVPTAADDEHGSHDHAHGSQMAGMLTPEQMAELSDARGTAFDRLFLERMIGHHRGALEMADETAGGGLDVRVGEARNDISAGQSAEIARMQQLLESL